MPRRPGIPGAAVRGFHGEAIVRSLFQPLRGGVLVETVLPWVHELRRDDDQRVLAPANGVLLHKRHADVGLAGPDAIRADHPAVPVDDARGPAEAILPEGGQVDGTRRRPVLVQDVSEGGLSR